MSELILAAEAVSAVSGLVAAALLFIKPLREKLLGVAQIREGQKCILRQQMLNSYYRHKDEDCIRQYEYENFLYSYHAYKAMGGNSFIDKIKAEVDTWEVET